MNRARFDPRVVLFDWDGTLLDSYVADMRAYVTMFRALGIDWGPDELQRHYSPDWYQVYRAAGVPSKRWAEADQIWRAAYAAECPALLPGARAAVRVLQQRFPLALVTSGSRTRVERQLRHFGFARVFRTCVFGEDTSRKKPDAAPLRLALQRLRAAPAECVYVGDTPEDVEMARRAGTRVIGVLGPFPSARRMPAARPDVLLPSIRELLAHLPESRRRTARE